MVEDRVDSFSVRAVEAKAWVTRSDFRKTNPPCPYGGRSRCMSRLVRPGVRALAVRSHSQHPGGWHWTAACLGDRAPPAASNRPPRREARRLGRRPAFETQRGASGPGSTLTSQNRCRFCGLFQTSSFIRDHKHGGERAATPHPVQGGAAVMRGRYKCRSGEQWSANCPEAASPSEARPHRHPSLSRRRLPEGLDATGAALWSELVGTYEWDDPAAYRTLLEACFAIQRAERCRKLIDEQGEVARTKAGLKSHPLLRDEVAARALGCRLLARLGTIWSRSGRLVGRPEGLPDADETSAASAAADRRRRAAMGSGSGRPRRGPPKRSEPSRLCRHGCFSTKCSGFAAGRTDEGWAIRPRSSASEGCLRADEAHQAHTARTWAARRGDLGVEGW